MSDDDILDARGVTVEFNGFVAVHDVSLTVRRGSIHALIGPNGAGKTTFFNVLTKFLQPTRGTITYNGRDITQMGAAAVARLGMVRSFQISATFPHMTLLENVRLALRSKEGELFDFWRSEAALERLDAQAMELLASVGLAALSSMYASDLSYGRKRALELATTLALDPDMMLLDEPTAGMGHDDIGRITDLIKHAAAQRTVLMVEHNLSVVSSICDRLTVLARGEILADGDYATISRNAEVIKAFLGEGAIASEQ